MVCAETATRQSEQSGSGGALSVGRENSVTARSDFTDCSLECEYYATDAV